MCYVERRRCAKIAASPTPFKKLHAVRKGKSVERLQSPKAGPLAREFSAPFTNGDHPRGVVRYSRIEPRKTPVPIALMGSACEAAETGHAAPPVVGIRVGFVEIELRVGLPESRVLMQGAGWAEGQHRWEPGRPLESEREWLLGRLRSWTELTLSMLHVRQKVAGQEAHTGIPSARDGFRQNGPRRWEPLWTCFGL